MTKRKRHKKYEGMLRDAPPEIVTRINAIQDWTEIGPCFCGKQILASIDGLAVMHESPHCERFHNTEVLQFVTELRLSRSN